MPLGVGLVVLVGLTPYAGWVVSLIATVYGIGSVLFRPSTVTPAVAGTGAVLARGPAEATSAPGRPIAD